MVQSSWESRIRRAEEVLTVYPLSSEILGFYISVLEFQKETFHSFSTSGVSNSSLSFDNSIPANLTDHFSAFLAMVESAGPRLLADTARNLQIQSKKFNHELLDAFWMRYAGEQSEPTTDFFARAFLQPYAVLVRLRTGLTKLVHTPCVCPFCDRKPAAGVLRPMGEGGQRLLLCSLCLAEWEFRRILCPACGEQDPAKLAIYSAEEFNYVRVEACETCKKYLKTVDLTKNGLADPVVDEVASISLDLWAQQHGYSKIQANLLQM